MKRNIFETGPDVIRDAIDEQVSWMFAEADEIGSSDVSACVKAVFASLGYDYDQANDLDADIIRSAVYNSISRLHQSA